MTRVRSESGAISILNVIIMLVLLIALGFAFELSAALDQQNAQTNDCSAARDTTMRRRTSLSRRTPMTQDSQSRPRPSSPCVPTGSTAKSRSGSMKPPPRLSPRANARGPGASRRNRP